ncbi:tRNA preQ1(34) S-adenosylmethionine ribosyltransferase-isomerase QueA [Desulfobacterales bacterium RS19-109]|uniref:S-adenosylmethionine:tRNA ribosyltransferase-isomerase n=2 Tax=Thiovibrio frasassiensis TaxID=2984131 RepID=A0A9X4MFC9_9BACT|nr:tRNA preQ1(34) S-adenosylmethionine ribosyltransferase-isomerase QueA [Thiovibrio frasassiensis]MDG4476236.1 tRNA preQ1(34) S-adenosylmethionine ribosyltransferase-isomerase QueA [Thiovibrio frasassiensis]
MASNADFFLASYQFVLPEENIAQRPLSRRDSSRLLVVDCLAGETRDRKFADICDYLAPGDLLVVNNTRVFPARLLGRKETGGKAELLILEYPVGEADSYNGDLEGWQQAEVLGLVKSAKRPQPGGQLLFSENLVGTVREILGDGKVRVTLRYRGDLARLLEAHGQLPLPPYIRREEGQSEEDRQRYQTVYAENPGAVAAPTAGLHFTPELLVRIQAKGVRIAQVTLHVGYGTFAPVRVEDIREHAIHAEYLKVSEETAALVNETRAAGGRIWAVGTTSVRALEFAAEPMGQVLARSGFCDLYIYPGYQFRVVDNLITNFHLPQSSLLFLVSALAGRARILAAYGEAVEKGYRFYSYGDAMVLITKHPQG